MYENGFITNPRTLCSTDPVSTISVMDTPLRLQRRVRHSGRQHEREGGHRLPGGPREAISAVALQSSTRRPERKSDADYPDGKDGGRRHLREYNRVLIQSKKGKLPTFNSEDELVGIMSLSDLLTNQQ